MPPLCETRAMLPGLTSLNIGVKLAFTPLTTFTIPNVFGPTILTLLLSAISEELIHKFYKEWFVLNKDSVFVKLYELSDDFVEFSSFYMDLFYNADVIIPLSSFINCDGSPVDLSFYLSQPISSVVYSNYWLFYFPLRFPKYVKCELISTSEIWESGEKLIEMLKKNHRAEKVTIRVYGYKDIKKSRILSIIAGEYKKRSKFAPFIQDNWFDIVIRETFYNE